MTQTLQIEKGVPMPAPARGGRKGIYPFAAMAVGDSFAVPLKGECSSQGHDKAMATVARCASSWSRRHDYVHKFSVRTVRDEGVVRCWRVA